MDNNNKALKPANKDFGTTVLYDVLGALSPKQEAKVEEVKEEVKTTETLNIPGFELPEVPQFVAPEITIEQSASASPIDSLDLNKKEKTDNQILDLETENNKLKAIIATQKKELDAQASKMAQIDSDNTRLKSELSNAKDNLRSEFEAQLNKAAIIEEKYNQLANRHEELKAKVRRDIRKIRIREKELTHKMELIKQDSETLLSSKDQKILQLKKYVDSLEFDIETFKEKIESLEEKLKDDEEKAQRVVRALRLSTSLLETNAKKKII